MPLYYKRRWEEPRGGAYDSWGPSWWYFEVNEQGGILRQLEQYDGGQVLKYSPHHVDDHYGGLGEAEIDSVQYAPFSISKAKFEEAWSSSHAVNNNEPELWVQLPDYLLEARKHKEQ